MILIYIRRNIKTISHKLKILTNPPVRLFRACQSQFPSQACRLLLCLACLQHQELEHQGGGLKYSIQLGLPTSPHANMTRNMETSIMSSSKNLLITPWPCWGLLTAAATGLSAIFFLTVSEIIHYCQPAATNVTQMSQLVNFTTNSLT